MGWGGSRDGATALSDREAVTQLLSDLAGGDLRASDELFSMVYDQLRSIASAHFRHERDDHTLQPTALVHEAYLKLVDQAGAGYESRHEFFKLASRAMRNILVDHARGKGRLKRGGDRRQIPLEAAEALLPAGGNVDVVALDEALERLASLDERKASLVELRFFGGLGADQAAEVLGISRSTAAEDWRFARAWLHRALREDADG